VKDSESFIQQLSSGLLDSNYLKKIAMLLTGTMLAQLIPLLLMPVLTRMYTPSDFGVWALCLSVASLLSIPATGRFELAIVLPENDEDAQALFWLCLYLCTFMSIATFLVMFRYSAELDARFDLDRLGVSVWLIPISIFVMGLFQTINYTMIRSTRYLQLSKNRVYNASFGTASQLALGFIETAGKFGLFLGQILGYAAAVILYFVTSWREHLTVQSLDKIKAIAVRYARFPLVDVPGAMMNTLSGSLPILFIPIQFGSVQLGIYALTMRALGAPMVVLANTFLDVYKEEASSEFARTGRCWLAYRKNMILLSIVALPPSLFLFFFGREFFGLFFGTEWSDSGTIASALSMMFFVRFVSSPLSYTIYIADRQIVDFLWQSTLLVATLWCIYQSYINDNFMLLIELISIYYSALYLIYILISATLASGIFRRNYE
jgi:O-antigen/teichoic acid export membrane protein